jgi:hypothetical protein
MPNKPFLAYQNESDSFTIGSDLTVENRLDRISIYGSLELTKDKEGLQYAYELKLVVDAAIEVLKKTDLPDKIEVSATESVDNPFA